MSDAIEDGVAPARDISPPPGPPFLTADWRDVIGITFPCSADQLTPHLPPGATIDTLEGSPRVSLVAFAFSKTRVRRIPVPGHIRFSEINLRFYVRYRGQRAVVFLRELVRAGPSRPSPGSGTTSRTSASRCPVGGSAKQAPCVFGTGSRKARRST